MSNVKQNLVGHACIWQWVPGTGGTAGHWSLAHACPEGCPTPPPKTEHNDHDDKTRQKDTFNLKSKLVVTDVGQLIFRHVVSEEKILIGEQPVSAVGLLEIYAGATLLATIRFNAFGPDEVQYPCGTVFKHPASDLTEVSNSR
jgi:hypothetical protein